MKDLSNDMTLQDLNRRLQEAYLWWEDGEFLESVGQKRDGFRTAATSKVELFVIIVNGCKSLIIITKSSTLDVAAVLDPPLKSNLICNEKMYWKKSTC